MISLLFDFCIVSIAILAFVDWFSARESRDLVSASQTISYIGKVKLIKPWKTSPYIVLTDSSKRDWRFSCYGPYQNQYWCDSFDFIAVGNQVDVEILAVDRLVYEVRAAGKTLLSYDVQIQRFRAAQSEGPSNLKLAFSAFAVLILALSIRSRIKHVERRLHQIHRFGSDT